jgi:hypothetical protein
VRCGAEMAPRRRVVLQRQARPCLPRRLSWSQRLHEEVAPLVCVRDCVRVYIKDP